MTQTLFQLFALLLTPLLVLSAETTAPAKTKKPAAGYLETGGERKLDVIYKKVGRRELPLDLYYPTANRAPKSPVVFYTHGGGWAAGNKQGAARGYFARAFTQLLA